MFGQPTLIQMWIWMLMMRTMNDQRSSVYWRLKFRPAWPRVQERLLWDNCTFFWANCFALRVWCMSRRWDYSLPYCDEMGNRRFCETGSRVWHMGPHESWNLGWLGPAVLQCHFRLDPCGSAKHWCRFFCQWAASSQCGQKCGFIHSTLASLTSPINRLHLPCRYKIICLFKFG